MVPSGRRAARVFEDKYDGFRMVAKIEGGKVTLYGRNGKRLEFTEKEKVFDPQVVTYEELLKRFWESHDPTQGMRQGNDAGTQYRSAVYTYGDDQLKAALASKEVYDKALKAKGFGPVTTEIRPAPEFYYAEDYHQQYLGKNPNGYCGLGGTGVTCPVGVLAKA